MAGLVDIHNTKKDTNMKNKVNRFCNGKVERKIERKAKKGKSSCKVRVPKRIDNWEVYDCLVANGYKVTQGIDRVTIVW